MATRRMVPTRFFKDPDIMNLQSRDTQLVLLGLILLADDEGRELAHPALIGRELDYPPDQIEAALQELEANDLLIIYQVGRHRYYSLTRWRQWQTLGSKMTPSKYPAPPSTPDGQATPEHSQKEHISPTISPGNSGEILENAEKSGGSSSQLNLIESNLGEEEQSPSVVIPFPHARTSASNEQKNQQSEREQHIKHITSQVAGNLKLAPTPALERLVEEFLAVDGLSLPGEADAAREWIDDKRRNKKRQHMTLAFFRRWLKREREQLALRSASAHSQPLDRATGTFDQTPTLRSALSQASARKSLMHLEQEYRATHPSLSQRKEQ